jgi:drug/metabolite transporter (DMT)-like permease
MTPSHTRAVAGMLLVTLMWSSAGLVTRQLQSAASFEVTFWRSSFTLLALGVFFVATQGGKAFAFMRQGGKTLWMSGLMWAVMFTCFMLAITMTTVANVLITMSISPLVTAVLARFMLGHTVKPRTWVAIVLAGAGIAWMYGHNLSADPKHLVGTLVALAVPIAAAINWILLQRSGKTVDLVPALFIGALISSVVALPFAAPFRASPSDLGWLAFLGVFQLAIPCALAVRLARHLPAPEISLLALLETVFGIAWVWWISHERPSQPVLIGGSVVLITLAVNEMIGIKASQKGQA